MKTPEHSRPDSVDAPLAIAPGELHLWLRPANGPAGSDDFRRTVLSRYAPRALSDWQFTVGPRGKPVILNPPRPLAFNLSDSGGWQVCAVTAGIEVGVDLEYCDAGRDPMLLARRFFHPAEIRALESLPEARRVAHFYACWTLKEARVKCRGEALAPSLAAAGFALGHACGGPGLIREHDPDPAFPAHYCLLEPLPDYRLATCWVPGTGAQTQLHLFQWPDGVDNGDRWQPVLLAASHPTELATSFQRRRQDSVTD